MADPSAGVVTGLLDDVRCGRPGAANDLFHLIYEELRFLALRQMGNTPPKHTLQPTALVHEAYARIFSKEPGTWANRHHFFFVATRAMHDILVESARKYSAQKRGGQQRRVRLEDDIALREQSEDLLALSEAIEHLSQSDFDAAQVVMLRFFGGLTHGETAEILGISEATVRRRWMFARAWLHRRIEGSEPLAEQVADEVFCVLS